MTRRLDSPETYEDIDPSGIGKRFLSLSSQVEQGWELGSEFRSVEFPTEMRTVLVAGMGGSAIGADLVSGMVVKQASSNQVVSWRNYGLPAWIDRTTLVVAVSVSGDTAETNSAFEQASHLDIPRIAITGPGKLQRAAKGGRVPVANIEWDYEPRAALGFTFITLYRALQEIGLVGDVSLDLSVAVSEVASLATALSPEVPCKENLAKRLAVSLVGRYPVIASVESQLGIAIRWKCQFNENADMWAAWDQIPEMKHNTIQGLYQHDEWPKIPCVVVLDPDEYGELIEEDIDRCVRELSANGVPHVRIKIPGSNSLSHTLAGCLLGDMVSYYAAIIRSRNPSTTGSLFRVKHGV